MTNKKDLPTDVDQLQSMVLKRDQIIADLNKKPHESTIPGAIYPDGNIKELEEDLENHRANYDALNTKLVDALKKYNQQRAAKNVVLKENAGIREQIAKLEAEVPKYKKEIKDLRKSWTEAQTDDVDIAVLKDLKKEVEIQSAKAMLAETTLENLREKLRELAGPPEKQP